jgi:hypothetical protein
LSLPATIGKSYSVNPFPLGVTRVATPGVAVQLGHNFTDAASRSARWVSLRGLDANVGLIYVLSVNGVPPWSLPGGGSTTGADLTNFLNIAFVLGPGEVFGGTSDQGNMVSVGQLWIDAVSAGDGVIATVFEF